MMIGLMLLTQIYGCRLFKKDCDCPKFNNGKAQMQPVQQQNSNPFYSVKTISALAPATSQ